jgi:hypothetical protein
MYQSASSVPQNHLPTIISPDHEKRRVIVEESSGVLDFHIWRLILDYLADKEGLTKEISESSIVWFHSVLLSGLTRIGRGLSVKERTKLMTNI